MERIRAWTRRREYVQVNNDLPGDGQDIQDQRDAAAASDFSLVDYSIFLLLGVSMLWAWNMFLAAGPYLEQRFRSSPWIANNFQAVELSVSSIGSLGALLLLTKMQEGASYPRRIVLGLIMNTIVFVLLALSTILFTSVSPSAYFGFVLSMVFATSIATALFQNGIFAYASGFGQTRYTQGIMAGQGIAGVLPCIAQIALVLGLSQSSTPNDGSKTPGTAPEAPGVPSSAALAYFTTAVALSIATFFAFSFLVRSRDAAHLKSAVHSDTPDHPATLAKRKPQVPIRVLFRKLFWYVLAVFLAFVITMQFPVFTQRIVSVTPIEQAPQILWPASFIPLAFLFWNTGDLIGRVLTAYPQLLITHRPRLLFLAAAARIVWVPLYYMCNIRDRGAVVSSDAFYLVVVQLFFGISNGYVGSQCMMGPAQWVEPDEREAAGGFMGLCLVIGLAAGSFISLSI